MKERYEYIHFKESSEAGKKTKRWECFNNESGLFHGRVKWSGAFWSYIFHPAHGSSFDHKCLRDIAEFTEGVTKELRKSWQQKKKKRGGCDRPC
jgi:hypothetical protein